MRGWTPRGGDYVVGGGKKASVFLLLNAGQKEHGGDYELWQVAAGFDNYEGWQVVLAGGFWSDYEHHESTGRKNLEESSMYIQDQQQHHQIRVVDDAQQKLDGFFPPSGDAA